MIALSVAKLKLFLPKSKISLLIKQKNFFVESLDQFQRRSTRKGRKCFVMSLCLSGHQYYTTLHLHQDFTQIFSLFSLIFLASKLLEFKEFNKIILLFHSHLLFMRLVIANSALRASAIYHLISNTRSWNSPDFQD